jgi:hypothetical protein
VLYELLLGIEGFGRWRRTCLAKLRERIAGKTSIKGSAQTNTV